MIFSTGKPWNQVLNIWVHSRVRGRMNTDSPSNLLTTYLLQILAAALVFWLWAICVLPLCPYIVGLLFMLIERRRAVQVGGEQVSACACTTSVHSFPDPWLVTNRQNLYPCFSFQGRAFPASQPCPGRAAGQRRLEFCGLCEATGNKQRLRVADAVLQPECGRVLCHLNAAQRCGAPLLPS